MELDMDEVREEVYRDLVHIATMLKDQMERTGVSVPELSRRSEISCGRIRRVLRAKNSRLNMKTITYLSYHLGLNLKFHWEDPFIAAVQAGMTESRKDREATKKLSDFQERYRIDRVVA